MARAKLKPNLPSALEEKNELDFQDVTNRIWAAIEQITKNIKLKATQSNLAKLASVSRGTINNRKWPLDELDKIKAKRKLTDSENSKVKKTKPDGQTEMTPEERLYLNREELRIWMVKAAEEHKKVEQLESIIETQHKQIEILKSEVTRLLTVISENKIVPLKITPKS